MTKLNEMLEGLYDLERHELRRLAAEALLISDGPDMPEEMRKEDPGTSVGVNRNDVIARITPGLQATFIVDIWQE